MFHPLQALLRRQPPHRLAACAVVTCLALAGTVSAGAGWMLYDARRTAWHAAEQDVQNLVLGTERDLGRTIEGYDLSLRATARALSLPGFDALTPEERQYLLFDGTTQTDHVGSSIVFDAQGRSLYSSRTPVSQAVNVADRDYFRLHRERPDDVLFVSGPFVGRLDGGRYIGLSRRLNAPDGGFAGVVTGAIRFEHIEGLFGALDLGEQGSMALFTTDGRLVAGRPYDAGQIGREVGGAPAFDRIAHAPAGMFVAAGSLDDVPRLYAYRRVGSSPFVLAVGLSERGIYASWTRTSRAVGAALLVMLALATGFALWLRRELRRRTDAEGAMRANAATLSAVLDALPVGVAIADARGRIVRDNAAHRHLWGTPPRTAGWEQYGGWIGWWPDTGERIEAHEWAMARALLRGETVEQELVECERFDTGERRFLLTNAAPVRDAAGRIVGGVVAQLDVTERRAAEMALRGSEARLQDLVATLDLASVLVRDLDGTVRFWSDGCRRLYGWAAEEAVGRSARDLFGAQASIPPAEIEAALLRDGEWSGDLVHRRRDGAPVMVAVREVLRRDARGRPVAVMANAADVTALRRARAELRRLNADLEGRVREEVAAREAAQTRAAHAERMQALGQLAGGVAHDFNNVLQAVMGGASLIEHRPGDAEGSRRLARMMLDAAGRGASITGRLLAFSRRGDLRAEAVDAPALLAGMREMLSHTLGAGVEIRVEAARGLPPLLADKGQLETVLVNLATNARDALSGLGTLTLAASAETLPGDGGPDRPFGLAAGAYVRLSVRDTGEGMDAQTLARASEPFFTTKPQGKGTGLGLAMTRGFAEQSGGALHIESAPGRGTTVSLWFPVAEAARAAAAPPDRGTGPAVGGRRAHLLLVDDDAIVRDVMAEQMQAAGYAVLTAASGAEALALLDAGEAVDLVVSDLSMPGMDGLALIREARRRGRHLPAILLTGFADAAELAVDGAVSNLFSLLCKPVTGPQLAGRVASLLGGAVFAEGTN